MWGASMWFQSLENLLENSQAKSEIKRAMVVKMLRRGY
ncbi:hypothetical protein Riv7116_5093 [Rivularia sp. PCC 7116]|nr:hypothetical protein Riv7116_5093 [Rivularia sp. PCC 7116]